MLHLLRFRALLLALAASSCVRVDGKDRCRDTSDCLDRRVCVDGRCQDLGDARVDGRADTRGEGRADARRDTGSPACVDQLDADTVALFDFSGATLDDRTGFHTATIVGGNVNRAIGKPGCDLALVNTGDWSPVSYLTIPNSPRFQLATGTVELWLKIDPNLNTGSLVGLVARDADTGSTTGHLALFWSKDDELIVRLERGANAASRCSAPKARGVWHHVRVGFGGGQDLALSVTTDGNEDQVAKRAALDVAGWQFDCSNTLSEGIDGNGNAWVVGAISSLDSEGALDKVTNPIKGMIDSLRISKVRR